MKKRFKFKKIIILILALLMTICAVAVAFAGGGNDDKKEEKEPDPTAGSQYTYSAKPNGASAGATYDYDKKKTYILEVSTGTFDGACCEKIIITYRTNLWTSWYNKPATEFIEGSEEWGYAEITQVLDIKEKGGSLAYDSSSYTTMADTYSSTGLINGSRYNTYVGLYPTNASDADGRYFSNGAHILPGLYWYYMYYTTGLANADNLEDYYIADKMLSDNLFPSNSTEYIYFQTEYDVKDIVKVEFVMENDGVADWSLTGFTIYEATIWARLNSSYGESVTEDGWSYCYCGPTMTSYSYLSDRLGLIMTNRNQGLYKVADCDYDSNRAVGVDNDTATVTFISPLSRNYNRTITATHGDNVYMLNTTDSTTDLQSNTNTVLNFEIEFADEYGAGIDTYFTSIQKSKATDADAESLKSDQLVYQERLYATINYTNDRGLTEEVTVPVVSSALLEAVMGKNYETTQTDNTSNQQFYDILRNKINMYCQQGQKLCFPVEFPNFKSLNSITLQYKDTLNEAIGTDSIIIKQITVYDDTCGDNPRNGYYGQGENGSINKTIPESCTALYTVESEDYNIYYDTVSYYHTYNLIDASTAKTATEDYSDMYFVTLKTADADLAATTDEIYVQFEYLTTSGGEAATEEYKLSEIVKEYYGYNPGIVSTATQAGFDINNELDWCQYCFNRDNESVEFRCRDSSYYSGLIKGGELSFYVKAADVSKFTGVNFRMEPKETGEKIDEWQLAELSIKSIDSIGERILTPLDTALTINYLTINNTMSRNITGETLYSMTDINLYISNDKTQTLDFESGELSGDVSEGRDYSDYYYSMTYDMASSNLGFTDVDKTYEVRVHVAGVKDSLTDDNAGSNNLFYFQLIFKNGSSGYVLANQQLSADGFRSGQEESFSVKVNEEMGDLTAIRIIPDDVTEDAEKVDKLCIDYIEVIKKNSNGVNKKYTIKDVGWINMEYHDDDETWSEDGRSVSELATTVSVTSSSYMLSLEVSITYGDYPKVNVSELDDNGRVQVVQKVSPQFEGQMYFDLVYADSNGATSKLSNQNLVEYMNDYDGLSAVTDTDNNVISNTEWMFRENSVDRFTIEISDASELQSFTLRGIPTEDTDITITDISISVLTSTGRRYITTDKEFKMMYSEDPIPLIDKTNRNLPETFHFGANKTTQYTFYFSESKNSIPSLDEDSNLRELIQRVPESVNDTMNVYIYMADGGVAPSDNYGIDLTTKIYYYCAATGKNKETDLTTYDEKIEDGQIVLYQTGITATNMTSLSNFKIKASSAYKGALFDHAVVQQIRDNTIVDTYYVSFIGTDATSRIGVQMSTAKDSSSEVNKQLVSVMFGSGTAYSNLVSESYDVAVALMYTSELDDGDTVYESPYVFLSDSGVITIKGGEVGTFEFSQANVKEIKGIKIGGTNGIEASIEGATIQTYETNSAGETILYDYYSINEIVALTDEVQSIAITSKNGDSASSLKLATFEFKTLEVADQIDSNGQVPIRMTVYYNDVNGFEQTKIIDDIRKIADSTSSFTAGGTARISTYLKGCKKITSINLEPYDDDPDNIATWNLDSVTFSVENTDSETARTLNFNQTIYEGSSKGVTLATLTTKVTVENNWVTTTFYNESGSVNVENDKAVYITPQVSGETQNTQYGYELYYYSGGDYVLLRSERNKNSNTGITFTGHTGEKFKVIIFPETNAQQKFEYIFTVPTGTISDPLNVTSSTNTTNTTN